MAMFSYLYYNSYVGAEVGVSVGSVLSSAVQLGRKEQLELWGLLANLLAGMLQSYRLSRCHSPRAITYCICCLLCGSFHAEQDLVTPPWLTAAHCSGAEN